MSKGISQTRLRKIIQGIKKRAPMPKFKTRKEHTGRIDPAQLARRYPQYGDVIMKNKDNQGRLQIIRKQCREKFLW